METKQIGKHIFHVGSISPRRALKVTRRLAAVIPAFVSIAGENGEGTTKEATLEAIGKAVAILADDDLDFITDALASATRVQLGGNGGTVVELSQHGVDAVFVGDVKGLIEWLAFGLRVNFGPLLAGAGPIG